MAQQFIPAADEVWVLHHRDGPECDLFRKVAEQGHYAGRTEPSDTRQGIYAFAPSGHLLASVNTRSARQVVRLLEVALERWDELPEADRYLDPAPDAEAGLKIRSERRYPADGLVLRVNARDLPRAAPDNAAPSNNNNNNNEGRRRGRRGRSWRDVAWNQDYAWFRADEMRSFIPGNVKVGAIKIVPKKLTRRLAQLHFVDNVRGQVSAFKDEHIKTAEMRTRIIAVDDDRITLQLEGRTRTVVPGRVDGASANAANSHDPSNHPRGVDTKLLGTLVWCRTTNRFERFDVVALGTRWGGTRFNSRERDFAERPIGFTLTLVMDDPPVAPAFLWQYGW